MLDFDPLFGYAVDMLRESKNTMNLTFNGE